MAYNTSLLTTAGPHGRRVKSVVGAQPGFPRTWSYMSDDAVATVRVAGYFSDGYFRGMRKGDIVNVVVTSGGTVTAMSICVVMTSSVSSAPDISDGSSITVTNSD